MREAVRSEDVASGRSRAIEFNRKFVSKKMVALHGSLHP